MTKRKPKDAKQLGITDARYFELLEQQGGVCGLCGNPPKEGGRRLHVDHDHKTETIRGLLCFRCNRALPHYVTVQWLLLAIAYLRRAELKAAS